MINLFKKTTILIIMLAIFMAPISASIKINKNKNLSLNVETKKVEAQTAGTGNNWGSGNQESNPVNVFKHSAKIATIKSNRAEIFVQFEIDWDKCIDKEKCREGKLGTNTSKSYYDIFDALRGDATIAGEKKENILGAKIWFILNKVTKDTSGKIIKEEQIGKRNWTQDDNLGLKASGAFFLNTQEVNNLENLRTLDFNDSGLLPETDYNLYIEYLTTKEKIAEWKTLPYDKNATTDINQNDIKTGAGSNDAKPSSGLDLGCGLFDGMRGLIGCVAGIFYMIWEVSAVIARFAGEFLDFFIYYATNSSSYSNLFVEKAWAAVRDIANILFIIALFYVAIKTVLGLNVSNNKKLVGMVIAIGLVINFSLFTTKLVIDGSNILAKIFYNNIISTDSKTKAAAVGAEGQKSISVGIIKKYDPQELITQDTYSENQGTFIFFTIFLIAITLYTAYIFFSVAILFVARVVSLWLSMIFSPIAFASYTVPFKISGFGHEEWWDNLIKNAMLAPIFIFFLYIIILFTGFLQDIISYTDSTNLSTTANMMQRLMKVTIPFIIISMLLKKSQELANKYAGDMGKAVMSGAKLIGGAALGAGAGSLALASRYTVGKGMAAAANSGWAKTWASKGWGGNTALTFMQKGAKSSMDIRGIKIAGKDLSSTGLKVNTFGKPQDGGYEKMRKEKVAEKQKRAKELEVGEDEEVKQHLNKVEQDLQKLLREGSHEIEQIDKQIKGATEANKVALAALRAETPGTAAHQEAQTIARDTATRVKELREQKKTIKNAKSSDIQNLNDLASAAENIAEAAIGTADYGKLKNNASAARAAANVAKVSATIGGFSINNMEDEIIPEAHHHVETENNNRKWNYSNLITSFYGFKGGANREAAHKIRMNAKIEHTGGKKGGHEPAAHAPAPAHHAEPAHEEHHEPAHDAHGDGGGDPTHH